MGVRHGIKGPLNNSLENLSYGTQSQNCFDKVRDGTARAKKIRRSDGKVFDSINQAARYLNGQPINISRCCRGVSKSSYGYNWEFADVN